MLEELLRIKSFREHKAASEVYRSQQVMEQRKREVDNAKDRLMEQRTFRMQREQALFGEIEGRPVSVRHLEQMRGAIARLREAEALLQQKIVAAEKVFHEARETWKESRRKHALRIREKEKFVQLVQIQRQEAAKAVEKKEETELEEFSMPAGRGG